MKNALLLFAAWCMLIVLPGCGDSERSSNQRFSQTTSVSKERAERRQRRVARSKQLTRRIVTECLEISHQELNHQRESFDQKSAEETSRQLLSELVRIPEDEGEEELKRLKSLIELIQVRYSYLATLLTIHEKLQTMGTAQEQKSNQSELADCLKQVDSAIFTTEDQLNGFRFGLSHVSHAPSDGQ